MTCSYELLENGNICIDDCDEVTGEKFALASAGYISSSEFNKIFTEVALDEQEQDCTTNQNDMDLEDDWEQEM